MMEAIMALNIFSYRLDLFKFNCTDTIFCNSQFLNIGMMCKLSHGIYQPCFAFFTQLKTLA